MSAKFLAVITSLSFYSNLKIPQMRIGAVLNGTTIGCVKFYYFARTAPDFEMASA